MAWNAGQYQHPYLPPSSCLLPSLSALLSVPSCTPLFSPLPFSLQPQIQQSKWPLVLKWRKEKDLPFEIDSAHAVVLNGQVYIGGGLASGANNEYIVLKYNPMTKDCSKLPMSAVRYFGMASVQDQLLLVGGEGNSAEIQLLDSETRHWTTPPYPRMPTGRTSPAAVGYQNYLIVLCGHYNNTVEILDCSTNRWYSTQPLPEAGHSTQSVACSEHVYVLLHDCDGECYIFTAHLPTLISNSTSVNHSIGNPTWHLLPFPPVHQPRLLVLQSYLLLVGGEQQLNRYDPEKKSWISCGQLPVAMCRPSCAVLPSGEVFVA